MKINEKIPQRLVKAVFAALKDEKIVTFKEQEEKVMAHAVALLQAEFNRERQLEAEVTQMMDQLEQANPGSFERYKLFPMLKKRLAKEKGIIL